MPENDYTIQELADLSGVTRRNIYFYTQQGILPPPQGAGLAARYSRVHLLRLRAIPCLRENGLRLDEIRQRLATMDEAGLAALLASEPPKPPSPPKELVVQASGAGSPNPNLVYTHYALPHGIVLVVPSGLSGEERHQVELLLASAARILSSSPDIQRNFC